FLTEVLAWLVPVGLDRRDRQLLVPAGAEAFGRAGGDQGAEALTQTAFSRHGTPLSQAPGTPWRPRRWNRTRRWAAPTTALPRAARFGARRSRTHDDRSGHAPRRRPGRRAWCDRRTWS